MDYQDGLSKAYDNENGLYQDGNRLYVAGTKNLGHVSEWWKIPFNQVSNSSIYRNMDEYLQQHPEIDTLVGHSYGSSAILHKQKQNNKYSTIAYNSPVFDCYIFTKHNTITRTNRYANMFDPVAALDFSARTNFIPGYNPHSYFNAPRRNNDFFNNDFVSYRDKRNKF